MHTPSHTNVCKFSQFSTHIFSADITPKMLKVCRVTKVKVFFLVLVYVFNFDSFEFRPPFWRRVYTNCFIQFYDITSINSVAGIRHEKKRNEFS